MSDTTSKSNSPSHFRGKDAVGHVIEAQAQSFVAASEIHGVEMPGQLSAGTDAARETSLMLILIWIVFSQLNLTQYQTILLLLAFSFGWLLWKAGRSAWLGWFRLERLHRIVAQERWEIEHHRQQERDELGALYAAKGFEGKLLEEVLDVLMADNDRLLKIMVEEELGLSLASQEHPLKQSLGAVIGVIISTIVVLGLSMLWTQYGIFLGGALTIGCAAGFSAYLSQNEIIPAVIWNLGIAILSFGSFYFLLQLI